MMFSISPLLAVISLLAVPASIVVDDRSSPSARRSSSPPSGHRPATLNGHVEEMHTGHAIVKVFGRQEEAIDTFDEENERLYQASYRAQFISGIIQPAMNFIANLNYVAIAVIGGAAGRRRARCRWATSGVHPVLAPVHVPDHPDGEHRQRPPVGGRLGRAGLRAARRGRGDPRPGRAAACSSDAAGAGRASRTSRSATCRTCRSSTT